MASYDLPNIRSSAVLVDRTSPGSSLAVPCGGSYSPSSGHYIFELNEPVGPDIYLVHSIAPNLQSSLRLLTSPGSRP